jgi:tRNA-splicing ligase RtcB (3'-phosphate/5'-hydroxy nucleic acid ligase)
MAAGRASGAFELVPDGPARYRLPPRGDMRVPGVLFTSPRLLPEEGRDEVLRQVANVATLPGIVDASYAMPDMHLGYGFPIGAVAATDVAAGGVVSPGGVGFDIACGVRLLRAPVTRAELGRHIGPLMDRLAASVPCGSGPGGVWELADDDELDQVLAGGAPYVVARGFGDPVDLTRCEDGGVLEDADLGAVGDRARERGRRQLGSLGSGNHFLEVQVVDEVLDPDVAAAFGLALDGVCVMLHTGSRGLGHQVCTDQVEAMRTAMPRAGIRVPDPQLACVPVDSAPGRRYLGAMAAAANLARANRQVLTATTRRAFAAVLGTGDLRLVYDVSHNLARLEEHAVEGRRRQLCVQRKGATPALPAGHPDLPEDLREVGQPVLVPGSMGTASYVLVGTAEGGAFHSTAHGAGRVLSRHAARRRWRPADLDVELAAAGVTVRAASRRDLPEEAPGAYKDIVEVVAVSERAGLARPVVRLRPLGVVKG